MPVYSLSLPSVNGVQGVKRKEGGKRGSYRHSVSEKNTKYIKTMFFGEGEGVGAVIYSQIFSFHREFWNLTPAKIYR